MRASPSGIEWKLIPLYKELTMKNKLFYAIAVVGMGIALLAGVESMQSPPVPDCTLDPVLPCDSASVR